MMTIDRKRRFLPPVYNVARVFEQPIPSIEPFDDDDDEALTDSDRSDDTTARTIAYDQEESMQSTAFEAIEVLQEEKPIIDEEDIAAFDDLFGDGRPIESQAENDENASNESTESLEDASISSSVLRESFMRSIRVESTRISVAINDVNVENASAHTGVNDFSDEATNDVETHASVAQITDIEVASANAYAGVDASSDVATNDVETHASATQNNDIGIASGHADSDAASNVRYSQNDDALLTKEQQIEANLREVLLRGTVTVIDDDLKLISLPDQQLAAIAPDPIYRTKANDLLSGNVPFKENVSLSKRCLISHG